MIIRHRLGFSVSNFADGARRVRARLSMPRQGRASWWLASKAAPSDVWDADAARFRRGSPSAAAVNSEIADFSRAVEEVFGRYELIEKRVPTLQEAKRDVDEALGIAATGDDLQLLASEVYDKYIEAHVKEWADSSFVNASKGRAALAKFNPRLRICDINDDVLHEFMGFMTDVLRYKNTTVSVRIVAMRVFLRWSYNNGYYTGNSHNSFRPRPKGVSSSSKEIIYCTRDEVHRLMELRPSTPALARVRDAFIFCCFTGLRHSDVRKLRRCDIHKDGYITVVTQKTADSLRIELNDHAAEILRRYGDPRAPKDSPALPVDNRDAVNRGIKRLAMEAGIDTMTRVVYFRGSERVEEVKPKYSILTFHAARRTFVVSALQLGIPAEVIMRWTGHSSYEAMKPYVAIVDELKRRSMDKFNDF